MNDKMYFHLHHEYKMLKQNFWKFFQQRVGFFKILNMFNNDLTIKLQLFFIMNIYSYVFITQFEFVFVDEDFYHCTADFFFFIINVFDLEFEYEINFLIQKKIIIKTDKKLVEPQYLTKWKDYDFEKNKWIKFSNLKHARGLIEDFEEKARNKQNTISNTQRNLWKSIRGPMHFIKWHERGRLFFFQKWACYGFFKDSSLID